MVEPVLEGFMAVPFQPSDEVVLGSLFGDAERLNGERRGVLLRQVTQHVPQRDALSGVVRAHEYHDAVARHGDHATVAHLERAYTAACITDERRAMLGR